ncbi:MAG: hypothetical protein AAB595_00555 [Patescibacteria group bacterium]
MIPQSIAKFFWDSNPQILDLEKNKRSIIVRILNYGSLNDWKWLKDRYGNDLIAEVATSSDRISIREPARKLAKIIFTLT